MKMYENIETGEVMTLIEVREHFYEFAKENPKVYDCMSFNEFLNDATGKNGSLREINDRYLVVGHNYTFRGELEYSFYDTLSEAINDLPENDTLRQVGSKDGVVRYASDNDTGVYEIWSVKEPYIVVRWKDKDTTDFDIFNFDVESDAYLFMLRDASNFLDKDYDAPRDIYVGSEFDHGVIKIDVGDELHRWNFIHNYT